MKCLITGGNSGIGKSAALQLAAKGVQIIIASRSMERGQAACEEIISRTGNQNVFAMQLDLSLISNVKEFVREYTERFFALDILINNAADFDLSRRKPLITSEGNEAQFATNHLAPFALTNLLLPLIRQSEDGRIIQIASKGLILFPKLTIDFNNLKGEKSYSPAMAYYQSKLAQVMFSMELREQLAGTNVSVYCIRVTNVKIDMNRYQEVSPIYQFLYRIKSKFSISPEEMARAYTELAIGEKRQGFYFDEKLREVKANSSAYDEGIRKRLWDVSQKLTK